MGDFVNTEKQESVMVIRMNQPKIGNCVDSDSYVDLELAFRDAEQDPEVKVVVFTGEGKHFSAGGNIRYFLDRVKKEEGFSAEEMEVTSKTAFQIRQLSKPTIALVNGCAYGAGMALALACDFRMAATTSSFSTGFIGMGLPGDTAGAYFLGKMLGAAKATELMMTGWPVNGKEAYDLGLITRLTEDGELEETTMRFARKLAQGPTKAYAQQKKLINEFLFDCGQAQDYGEKEAEAMAEATCTEDFREAVHAFLEKRPASFRGM